MVCTFVFFVTTHECYKIFQDLIPHRNEHKNGCLLNNSSQKWVGVYSYDGWQI